MASRSYIPNCPHCDSEHTTATPHAGPGAEFHCLRCDRSFNASDP